MQPNLDRIPGDGDARARSILQGLPATLSQALVDSLNPADWLAFGRYGIRQATIALRTGSPDLLRDALMAKALASLLHDDDPRDTMVGLALHVHVAHTLDLAPAKLFDDVASRLPAGEVATLLRTFGARTDITLTAFGWQLAETPSGPDFAPG